jgi:hypothetical protein
MAGAEKSYEDALNRLRQAFLRLILVAALVLFGLAYASAVRADISVGARHVSAPATVSSHNGDCPSPSCAHGGGASCISGCFSPVIAPTVVASPETHHQPPSLGWCAAISSISPSPLFRPPKRRVQA